jgi:hypothetical protein
LIKSINTSAPVDEILNVLTKHNITIGLMPDVFARVTDKAHAETVVAPATVVRDNSKPEISQPQK